MLNLIINILISKTFSKYNFIVNEEILLINIDTLSPKCVVKYSTTQLTNESVLLEVYSNEPIKEVNDFEINDEKRILSKIINNNCEDEIKIYDLYGNYTTVKYNVSWIDKEIPLIEFEKEVKKNSINIELTKLYDNKEVIMVQYLLDGNIVHIESGENLKLPQKYTYTNLKKEKSYEIKIVVKDKVGNQNSVIKNVKL